MQPLNFPVMLVSPYYILGQITSEKKLTTVGEIQYEKGCFDKCFIVDAEGYKYDVVSASKVKRLFSFFNYNKSYRNILISLELSEPKSIDFEDYKKLIFNMVLKSHWYNQNIGVSNETELRDWFSEANSFKEMIMLSGVFSK